MKKYLIRTTKPALLLTGTALSALALSGCGSHDTGSVSATHGASSSASATASYGPAATGPHNAQDVRFLTGMVPHHEQAVEMADMVLSRDTNAEVKALATQIKAAQGPEIAQMSGWLLGWGQSVPTRAASMDHGMSGMGHSNDGMMTDAEMIDLDQAAGSTFAKMFLTGMTTHHQGAVEMARTELVEGQNAQTKQLATAIISAQEKEIATMKALLVKLGG